MDYSDLIQQAFNHIRTGHKDSPSLTKPLRDSVLTAIAEQKASPDQQARLRDLAIGLEALLQTPTKPNFPGSGTTSL